jgi:hypothetical protein
MTRPGRGEETEAEEDWRRWCDDGELKLSPESRVNGATHRPISPSQSDARVQITFTIEAHIAEATDEVKSGVVREKSSQGRPHSDGLGNLARRAELMPRSRARLAAGTALDRHELDTPSRTPETDLILML